MTSSFSLVATLEQPADGMDSHGDEVRPQIRADQRYIRAAEMQSRRCGRVGVMKLSMQQRLRQCLRRGAEMAATLRVGPHAHRFLLRVWVQQGDRRVAVLAFTEVFQIDGRSAFGAAYLADLRPDPLKFSRGHIANELLLPQELKEWRKSPV